MAKGNGKPDLDLEHELPPAEDTGDGQEGSTAQAIPDAGAPDELRKLKAERETLYERLARQQADFENQRKRMAKEQSDYREYALADAIKALLPIVDSFDQAIKHEGGEDKDFRSGVELINRQLHDALTKLGVRPVPAQGALF